ncbi:MAG: cytochrome C oxidase subunit IV family protein [Deltaproteobacteria bacterium]|nr:cytochrome C oxidase subunit IV family protein [Deltaproteobacteria bacterium]
MAEQEEHTGPGQAFYVKIWGILLVLLLISILGPVVAPHIEDAAAGAGAHFLKGWMITLMTAFGIALYKAYLVAANFMHLNIEKRYITLLLTAMLTLMLLFFAGVSPDVMKHKGQNWENVAAEAEVDRALKAQESGSHDGEHHEGAEH